MSLEECREKIDSIDEEILLLLDRRSDVVREIAAIKQCAGLPIIDREREAAILRKAAERSDPLACRSAKRVFVEILRQSRKLQSDVLNDAALVPEVTR
jgi:chorismate mutase